MNIWTAQTSRELARNVAPQLRPELLRRLHGLPEPARRRRIVQQALRRSVLAKYASMEPGKLELAFEPGEPLSSPVEGLLVSASHFDDVTALAVTDCGLALGVDVEPAFEEDWSDALDLVLNDKELQDLNAMPARRRPARYFEIWTLKESIMKADGTGLGRDPKSIAVAATDRGPKLTSIDGQAPAEPWAIWSGPLDGYILSFALCGVSDAEPMLFSWPG